jgi:hypothetical protein
MLVFWVLTICSTVIMVGLLERWWDRSLLRLRYAALQHG